MTVLCTKLNYNKIMGKYGRSSMCPSSIFPTSLYVPSMLLIIPLLAVIDQYNFKINIDLYKLLNA